MLFNTARQRFLTITVLYKSAYSLTNCTLPIWHPGHVHVAGETLHAAIGQFWQAWAIGRIKKMDMAMEQIPRSTERISSSRWQHFSTVQDYRERAAVICYKTGEPVRSSAAKLIPSIVKTNSNILQPTEFTTHYSKRASQTLLYYKCKCNQTLLTLSWLSITPLAVPVVPDYTQKHKHRSKKQVVKKLRQKSASTTTSSLQCSWLRV